MGWTGSFGWWDNRDTNLEIFKKVYDHNLEREIEEGKSQACQRGSNVYILYTTGTGSHWVVCYLCQRNKKDNEFLTKDIDAIGNYCFDFPKSWIKYLDKNNEDVKNYIQKRNEYEESKKASKVDKVKIGDIIECESKYDIRWADGRIIKANEKFFVKVSVHNPYAKKKTKDYLVANQYINSKGEVYYTTEPRRIARRTFNNIAEKKVIG